jgi:hypothetical protein
MVKNLPHVTYHKPKSLGTIRNFWIVQNNVWAKIFTCAISPKDFVNV